MSVQLIVAGSLAVLAAAVHGIAGEALVVKRLSLESLPATRFGGPRMTRTMIHVTWHVTSVAFLAVGLALVLSGTVLGGEAARGVGLVGAATESAFAAVMLGLGIAGTRTPRALLRHPGPLVLAAAAALAWWGVL